MTSTGTGILYSLVAHRPVILAEYSETTADYEKVVQAILEKIPPNDSKLTYVYDQYLFHYVCEDDVVYLCMADSRFGRRIPFAFLEDVKHEFLARYGDQLASKLPAYAMNTFSNVLARKMKYYSSNPNVDAISQARGEIAQVKDVMVQNIERVLERGDRIEILVDKADALSNTAFAFHKRSTTLRRTMWWKNQKLMFTLTCSFFIMVYIIVCTACGFPTWSQCRA